MESFVSALLKQALMKNGDHTVLELLYPGTTARMAALDAALEASELEGAISAARTLKKVLPGHELRGIEASNRHSDGMVRVVNDARVAEMIEMIRSYLSRVALPVVELPFHDITSWIEYCGTRGVTGPESGEAQCALIGELMDPVLERLNEIGGREELGEAGE